MIDRGELQDSVRKAFPLEQLRPERDASWQKIIDAGWVVAALGEEHGGLGLGRDAATAIQFELGRVLSGAPLTPAILALEALASDDCLLPDRQAWIDRVCGGELISLSFAESCVAADPSLSGSLECVPDADIASNLLVFAPGLAALVPMAGAQVSERRLWDTSRRMFHVKLTGHCVDPDLVIARGDAADRLQRQIGASLALALAADALGGARAVLDMAVDYLKMRKQFGRPLAMFQALKHRCADHQVLLSAAEALMWSRAADARATDIDLGSVKALACDVYRIVAEDAIQLHGGIGLTDEHPCHHFMKRAMLSLQLGGSTDMWREQAGRQALSSFRNEGAPRAMATNIMMPAQGW